jgi:methionyl-tRNA synthetase
MVNNYCPYCGRFMQMRDFEHACDMTNKMRGSKEWCSRCGAPLSMQANDDMENAKCHKCQIIIDPFMENKI